MSLLRQLLESDLQPRTPATVATPATQEAIPAQESQASQGGRSESAIHVGLLALAESEGLDAALVHELTGADLQDCKSLSDAQLCVYLSMLADTAEREACRVPATYTARAMCRHCGPVWLSPAVADALCVVAGWPRVLGCPWCHVTPPDGLAIPRPSITCAACAHWTPDTVNPDGGMGPCKCGHQYPNERHACADYQPRATPYKKWLLSAFEFDRKPGLGTRTDTAKLEREGGKLASQPGGESITPVGGDRVNRSSAYAPRPSGIRAEEVAGTATRPTRSIPDKSALEPSPEAVAGPRPQKILSPTKRSHWKEERYSTIPWIVRRRAMHLPPQMPRATFLSMAVALILTRLRRATIGRRSPTPGIRRKHTEGLTLTAHGFQSRPGSTMIRRPVTSRVTLVLATSLPLALPRTKASPATT